jgi:uncharacterized protein with GYD domain
MYVGAVAKHDLVTNIEGPNDASFVLVAKALVTALVGNIRRGGAQAVKPPFLSYACRIAGQMYP